MTAAPSESGARIPHAVFQSVDLAAGDRFYAWRESVLPLFDSIPDGPANRFRARVEGVELGPVFVGMSALSPLRFHRERRHRAAESADHLLVQLYLSGGYVGHNGYREVQVRPGDISLLDLGLELQTRAQASNALSLIVPREQLYTYTRPEHLRHGTVLRGDSAVGSILGQHLLAVWQQLRSAPVEDIGSIRHLLLSSVVGAFTSAPRTQDGPPARLTLEAIRAYIARHLGEPLTPETLCRHFACSRAQLYRLFEPCGGVAAYIREARLHRCWQELSENGGRTRRIVDVAMRWGFTSQSHFNRLFHQAFGMTPGEAQWRSRPNAAGDEPYPAPALHDILRRL